MYIKNLCFILKQCHEDNNSLQGIGVGIFHLSVQKPTRGFHLSRFNSKRMLVASTSHILPGWRQHGHVWLWREHVCRWHSISCLNAWALDLVWPWAHSRSCPCHIYKTVAKLALTKAGIRTHPLNTRPSGWSGKIMHLNPIWAWSAQAEALSKLKIKETHGLH